MVSELSFGNWVTHGNKVDDDTATACVRAALDVGVNTFDTADVYAMGRAEEILGRNLAGERRETVVISTKVYWPTGPTVNERCLSRKHMVEAIDGSLRRLGVDYVDVYHAHRFDYSTPLEETFETFSDLVRAGKVLYVGVSQWLPEQIAQAAALARELRVRLVSNQPNYSMLWRVIEPEVMPLCAELGIGQMAWWPLAQGVLTGKYAPGVVPEGSRAATVDRTHAVHRFLKPEILTRVGELRSVADEAGVTLAQLAIAWVLQRPNVSTAVVGASRPQQIRDNAHAIDISISDDMAQRIDAILDGVVETDPRKIDSPRERPDNRPR